MYVNVLVMVFILEDDAAFTVDTPEQQLFDIIAVTDEDPRGS